MMSPSHTNRGTSIHKCKATATALLLLLTLTSPTSSYSTLLSPSPPLENPPSIPEIQAKPPSLPTMSTSNPNKSTSTLFSTLDKDQSGTLTPSELLNHLSINLLSSDTNLDTHAERLQEAKSLTSSMDTDKTGTISQLEVKNFLIKNVEDLTNMEECADWVQYSLQLPVNVRNAFIENAVTGGDFETLISNDSIGFGDDFLKNEVGITRASWRSKILRNANFRLLGIGTKPNNVTGFGGVLSNCQELALNWPAVVPLGNDADDTASAGGSGGQAYFPIHSYRVQRRVKVDGGHVPVASPAASGSGSNIFTTIYVGPEKTFTDYTLTYPSAGSKVKYVYRIQAWNAAGRSMDWVESVIDIPHTCQSKTSSNRNSEGEDVFDYDLEDWSGHNVDTDGDGVEDLCVLSLDQDKVKSKSVSGWILGKIGMNPYLSPNMTAAGSDVDGKGSKCSAPGVLERGFLNSVVYSGKNGKKGKKRKNSKYDEEDDEEAVDTSFYTKVINGISRISSFTNASLLVLQASFTIFGLIFASLRLTQKSSESRINVLAGKIQAQTSSMLIPLGLIVFNLINLGSNFVFGVDAVPQSVIDLTEGMSAPAPSSNDGKPGGVKGGVVLSQYENHMKKLDLKRKEVARADMKVQEKTLVKKGSKDEIVTNMKKSSSWFGKKKSASDNGISYSASTPQLCQTVSSSPVMRSGKHNSNNLKLSIPNSSPKNSKWQKVRDSLHNLSILTTPPPTANGAFTFNNNSLSSHIEESPSPSPSQATFPSSPPPQKHLPSHSYCTVCSKKFKFLRRHRHYCCRCLQAFCQGCGERDHSNYTSCEVPGGCVCERCLVLDDDRD